MTEINPADVAGMKFNTVELDNHIKTTLKNITGYKCTRGERCIFLLFNFCLFVHVFVSCLRVIENVKELTNCLSFIA